MAASGGAKTVTIGEISRAIHTAYSALRGIEANRALVPYSLDHAIQEQIDSLKLDDPATSTSAVDVKYSTSKSKGRKLTKYDRIVAVQNDLKRVVDAISSAGSDPKKLANLGLGD